VGCTFYAFNKNFRVADFTYDAFDWINIIAGGVEYLLVFGIPIVGYTALLITCNISKHSIFMKRPFKVLFLLNTNCFSNLSSFLYLSVQFLY
jgi:hypothetical protein